MVEYFIYLRVLDSGTRKIAPDVAQILVSIE